MRIVATIWNFVIKHVNSFRFKITRIGAWVFNIVQYGFKFNIEQEGDFHFVLGPFLGDWILRDGFWNDDGIWIDSLTWKDS